MAALLMKTKAAGYRCVYRLHMKAMNKSLFVT